VVKSTVCRVHLTCLSRQPYLWLSKHIFQPGILSLYWVHFLEQIGSECALVVESSHGRILLISEQGSELCALYPCLVTTLRNIMMI
jgi:hypothetical protein